MLSDRGVSLGRMCCYGYEKSKRFWIRLQNET